jgi:hypothetical protein
MLSCAMFMFWLETVTDDKAMLSHFCNCLNDNEMSFNSLKQCWSGRTRGDRLSQKLLKTRVKKIHEYETCYSIVGTVTQGWFTSIHLIIRDSKSVVCISSDKKPHGITMRCCFGSFKKYFVLLIVWTEATIYVVQVGELN